MHFVLMDPGQVIDTGLALAVYNYRLADLGTGLKYGPGFFLRGDGEG